MRFFAFGQKIFVMDFGMTANTQEITFFHFSNHISKRSMCSTYAEILL